MLVAIDRERVRVLSIFGCCCCFLLLLLLLLRRPFCRAQAGIVAPLLATVLEQLSNGGGAKSVTVESVGEEVEELGRQYPIRIPAYFGLIIR